MTEQPPALAAATDRAVGHDCRHPGPRQFPVFAPVPEDVCREMFGTVPGRYSGEVLSVCCCDCGEVTVRRPWER